jgi:peptide/histidine transporter 3/4
MEDNSKDIGSESESNSGSMQDILQLSNRSAFTGNRLNMNFKPSYRIRKLKNKGALLILVWNCLVMSAYQYLTTYPVMFHPTTNNPYSIIWGLTLPIAGWLADVYLKRYKVIRWSILIMWIASVLVVASSVLSQLPAVEHYYHSSTKKGITMMLLIVMSLGFGGYQANVVLFGIDQLQDASTDEITSFIMWYVFTYFSSGMIIKFVYICLGEAYNSLLQEFLVCICLTITVVLTFLCNRILLIEPITQNPFQLVYKVIKYAIKTKHPRCRSAFTYCEDDLPSRIDFGKHKYGGPFTIEEVENVKTFLRMLVAIFITTAMACGALSLNSLEYQLTIIYKNDSHDTLFHFDRFHESNWVMRITIWLTFYFGGTLLILLYELIFYPLLRSHVPYMQNYQWKLAIGVLSQITKVIAFMAIDLTARHSYIEHNNATIQCIFIEQSGILNSSFNMQWMILVQVFTSISVITSVTGAFEFICSQSPYSMRGLLFGATYCIVMLYCMVGYGVMQPFTKQSTSIAWGTDIISCEFWYLLLILFILILNSVMICILSKWYKNRKREDVLPNEQVFAERYYTS